MRFPEFLKDNGTIEFVSPSFSAAREPYRTAFNEALKVWEAKGYKTILGPNTYVSDGIGISTKPKECACELTKAYTNSDSDVIISCGGGELMCEILPYLDFEEIKGAEPKWYLGYSDNTNFTFLVTTICDVASIYGPCAPTFGMKKWHPALTHTYELLKGQRHIVESFDYYEIESLKDEDHPLEPYNCTKKTDIGAYVPAKESENSAAGIPNESDKRYSEADEVYIEGRLIGGCMDCLVNLLGTRFDYVADFVERYKDDGIIWYLEACDLNVFSIRRAMWQMQEAGWFKYVKGYIFGRPYNGEDMFNLNRFNAVLPIACGENKVPAILDADVGHLPPQMPLVNGALAKVYFNSGKLKIDMDFK